jgi:hypothetical protein
VPPDHRNPLGETPRAALHPADRVEPVREARLEALLERRLPPVLAGSLIPTTLAGHASAASLTPMLTTAESTASATSPAPAARRLSRPPTAAIATAIPSHSRDRSAALDSPRIGRSSTGVGVSATAE